MTAINRNAPDTSGNSVEGNDHKDSAEDIMTSTETTAPTPDIATGSHLKALRESHGLRIEQVAILANTTVSYLTKVEAGQLSPARSYIAKVTEAICKLMAAPPRPCAMVGCLGINHREGDVGDPDDRGWHTAHEVTGDEWEVSVDQIADDQRWTVYGRLADEAHPLTQEKVQAFYEAWSLANAYAATLNRSGYASEVR